MCASGSSRSRTSSQFSQQAEKMTGAPVLLGASRRQQQDAGRESLYIRKESPAPQQQYQRLGDQFCDEDSHTASTTIRAPSAPSNTVPPVVQPGDGNAETGRGSSSSSSDGIEVRAKEPLPSSLRERAVRTWWRGLSCGVCFAAGAWAREGHGVYGVVLALVAVVGEAVLYYGGAARCKTV